MWSYRIRILVRIGAWDLLNERLKKDKNSKKYNRVVIYCHIFTQFSKIKIRINK